MERKTAKEYKIELKSLEHQIQILKQRISNRLLELCKQNPEASVALHADGYTIIKASSIGNANYIIGITMDVQLKWIEAIEKYLTDQFPYKQTKIEFND